MTANQINYAKLQEDIRHNIATEGEAYRHNAEDERIRSEANAINMSAYEESVRHNVRTEAINEEHYGRMDGETARNHLAQEAETYRSNLAKEAETNRSNMAKEAETYRTNVTNEEIRAEELGEKVRHDQATEAETLRNDLAMEVIANKNADANVSQAETAAKNARTRYQEYLTDKYYKEHQVGMWNATLLINQMELDEKTRHDKATEKENKRHNKEEERIQHDANNIKFITTPTSDSETAKNKAIINTEYAKASEALARSGYLKTETDWYAWNQIVDTAVDISQAVKNFGSIVHLIG